MENEDQLVMLKQAVEAWNTWRTEHPDVSPDLSRVNLNWANLREADLRRMGLSGARLRYVSLFRADLRETDLREADLRMAGLGRADLRGANLTGADLEGADLGGADLGEADLRGARLVSANLKGANLKKARFDGAEVGATVFEDNDFREVTGLESVTHRAPSTIGTDTLYNSRGEIPGAFLRGAGVPENLIEQIPALAGDPVQFFSCFISYGSQDRAFAERLYADLQAKGVRCWLAPEALKLGDKIRPAVDASTRTRDKLLMILSTQTVESAWVAPEVEVALREEQRRKQPVLFPVRVDGAVMETDQAWAADIRQSRDIGDFEGWNGDAEKYDAALEDLLATLRVGEAGPEG